jgi:hypothetical protein
MSIASRRARYVQRIESNELKKYTETPTKTNE